MNPGNPNPVPEELRYAVLRAASELFKKAPAALAPEEFSRVEKQARREFDIEQKILESAEAGRVVVPAESVERAYAEIRQRYEDEDAFLADLAGNGLDEPKLRAALERQCKVESVLDLVGSRAPEVSEIEVQIYYHSHMERFRQPERREAYHILVSINPDFPENIREKAEERIREIAERLERKPKEFERLATRHSECPTGLQGGRLGLVPRGELYPELDEALFALKEGKFSRVVESPMGFHILWCKTIEPGRTLSLRDATPRIRQHLKARQQRICQRAWVSSLSRSTGG
jgi:peptidyl-prolyl cis-trans isomerase C